MELKKIQEGNGLTIKPVGRIDVSNAIEFGKEVEESLENVSDLVIDFNEVSYISSAGLRAILDISRIMDTKHGTLRIANLSKDVSEVFKMTGFDKIITII